MIIGDKWAVDHYRHDPFEKPSPVVTINVMVKSVPAAQHGATIKRCAVYIPANTIKRVVVEGKGSGNRSFRRSITATSPMCSLTWATTTV